MKRYNNKYRIPSARLTDYDYSANGDYFITICTAGRMRYFGKINKGEMILNEMGIILENVISMIAVQFQNITIVEFIIMPDHVHFIVKINIPVETRLIASLRNEPQNGGITGNNNPMFKEGVPRIVRWFKGRATFELRKINAEFAWQARYHDRIIRNEREYFAVKQYIKSNPKNWDNDFINRITV